MKKIKFVKTYEDDNGNTLCDIEVGGEIFKGIKAINLNKDKCRNCYYECEDEGPRLRYFDCIKNAQKLQDIFNIFTTLIVSCLSYFVFTKLEYNFFTKVAILIISLTGLDVVCCFIEDTIPKIYDWFFVRKLKKKKAKDKKLEQIALKEKQKQKEKVQAEKLANVLNNQSLIFVKAVVQRLRELSDSNHYGENEAKINTCVEKCEAIVQKIQEDSTGYRRVIHVLEENLTEFCGILEIYTTFIKNNEVTQQYETIFIECVDIVLEFLESQKIKAILENDSVQIQFQASADTLKKMLEEEMNK